MAIYSARSVVIATKIEATAQTDPMTTPGTADVNTQLAVSGDPTIEFTDDTIPRELRVSDYSGFGTVLGKSYATVGIRTEFRGRGAIPSAATPLRDNPLFVAGQLSPAYVAGTSATYTPSSAMGVSSSSATTCVYSFYNGMLSILRGGRAKQLKIGLTAGKTGTIDYTLQGIVTRLGVSDFTTSLGIRDQANPTSDIDAFATKPPAILGITLNLNGATTLKVRSLEVTVDYDVAIRDNAINATGIEGMVGTGRRVAGVITIEPETRATSSSDFQYLAEQSSNVAFTTTIGVALNQMVLAMPAMQLQRPKWTQVDGLRLWEIPFTANRNSAGGDDELSLQFR